MNNRQAGAFRELIRREERTRELWHASMNARTGNQNGAVVDGTIGANGAILPPLQTRGGILPVADSQPVANTAYLPADNMAPIDPHGIYQRAIRIGSPHLIDEQDRGIEDAAVRTQRVVRQVELPVSREVKVPVNTRQIVQTTVPRRVRTTRLVEVPSFKTVSQPYTAVEERPAVRHREIWVKKLVPERYMQRVEVQKSRNIRVPTTEVKEVADYAIVQVPAHTTVDVPGYRVDTVEDSKLVEVEEHVPMEMRPVAAGRAQVVGHRDIGPLGLNRSRQIGAEVYHHQDPSIAHVELDNAPVDPASRGIARPYSAATRSLGRSNTQPRGAITSRSIPLAATAPFDNANYDASPATDGNLSIGFRVRDAAGSRSVEAGGQQGCLVFKVHSGEPAQRAGLQVGDMVTHVNNKPTRNIAEFRSVINNSTGPMLVRVKRRGGFSLALTIHR